MTLRASQDQLAESPAAPTHDRLKPGPREGFRWTEETIGYAIDLWHRKHLRTPTKAEWMAAGAQHPCADTVIRIFGSWNAAIRSAGFSARRRGQAKTPTRTRRWTEDAITEAVKTWHQRHGRVPKKADWDRAQPEHPSRETVIRMFGTWNAALRAAGLTPRRPRDYARTEPARCAHTGRFLPRTTAPLVESGRSWTSA